MSGVSSIVGKIEVVLKSANGDVSNAVLGAADSRLGFVGGASMQSIADRLASAGSTSTIRHELDLPMVAEGQVAAVRRGTGGLDVIPLEVDALPGLGSTQLHDTYVWGVRHAGWGGDDVVGLLQRDSRAAAGWRLLHRQAH